MEKVNVLTETLEEEYKKSTLPEMIDKKDLHYILLLLRMTFYKLSL